MPNFLNILLLPTELEHIKTLQTTPRTRRGEVSVRRWTQAPRLPPEAAPELGALQRVGAHQAPKPRAIEPYGTAAG